jgi:hypothetical protein
VSDEQARRWVNAVWGEQPGHFHFAFGVGGHFNGSGKYAHKRWQQRSGRWPDDRDRFLAEAIGRAEADDVYVAPYLRSNASRKKGNALASRMLYADVDEAHEENRGFARLLIGPGGLLVNSGHGLHVYITLPEGLEPDELEQLNRHLAHRLQADSGWAENKLLRLPGTWNHKTRASGGVSRPVFLVDSERAVRDWSREELIELLGPTPAEIGEAVSITPAMPETVPTHPLERLGETAAGDRSAQSFAFVGACLRAGLSDAETLALALEHEPTTTKFGDRAQVEIERSIAKLRASGNSLRTTRDSASLKKTSLPVNLPFARLSEALANVEEQPQWVWRGYLARGVTSLLAARPKVGKSTLAHGLLAALEQGSCFLGADTARTGALLLTEEPLAAVRQKASRFDMNSLCSPQSLRARNEFEVHLLRRAQALRVPWPEAVEQAIAYSQEHELGLLVIDTFDKWTGLRGDDENKTGAILQALEPLNAAVAAGLAVLLIAHHRKSGGQYGEGVRGGNALVGWADIVIELDRLPAALDETRSQRKLSCIGRFEEVPELVVALEEHAYVELGSVDEVRVEQEREQLLEALREIGGSATAKEIGEALDLTESAARARLHAATRRQELVRTGAGKKGDPLRWGEPAA